MTYTGPCRGCLGPSNERCIRVPIHNLDSNGGWPFPWNCSNCSAAPRSHSPTDGFANYFTYRLNMLCEAHPCTHASSSQKLCFLNEVHPPKMFGNVSIFVSMQHFESRRVVLMCCWHRSAGKNVEQTEEKINMYTQHIVSKRWFACTCLRSPLMQAHKTYFHTQTLACAHTFTNRQ
jgi:hypothetical protein